MDDFVALDLDSDFRDFNFCSLWDPALRPKFGPTESSLYKLAYLARKGDKIAAGEYANTLDWTLREESLECFQRAHGPRPIRHRHWLYAKLEQLLGIFLYDELLVYGVGANGSAGKPRTARPWDDGSGVLTGTQAVIQLDNLARAFSPEDCAGFDWMTLLRRLVSAGENHMTEFERILQERIKQGTETGAGPSKTAPRKRRKHWIRNEERDSIIVSCLDRNVDRSEICRILDRKGIETTKKMKEYDLNRWVDAWEDSDFENNVQQLFTKVYERRNSVKS